MWKVPHRPANEITQSYNDGLVTIYAVANIAEPGYQPVEGLTKKVVLRYEEQVLGIQRFYSGRQNQVDIERVIRVIKEQKVRAITGKDISLKIDSICVHGDGVKALQFVQLIRECLKKEGIEIMNLKNKLCTRSAEGE